MSPRSGASAGGEASSGRAGITALILVIAALGMFLLVRAQPSADAFDPRSSRPDGARAMVLLLEDQGALVEIGRTVPVTGSDRRVLVLVDRLDDRQRSDLLDFVDRGGVAIVADPLSTLHGGAGPDGGAIVVSGEAPGSMDDTPLPAEIEANIVNSVCDIAALGDLRGVFVESGLLFPTAPDESQCFGTGDVGIVPGPPGVPGPDVPEGSHAFVIRRNLGTGVMIGLGDNGIFTNGSIRYADNSGLATALLVPQRGAKVTILLGTAARRTVDDIGTGDQSLSDLVRPGVWMAFAQLAVAFVMFAAATGVRAGRVVSETRPVPLAGSEFVRASGAMMRRARHHDRAGWLLRLELHRELCRRYRLPPDTDLERLVEVAAERDGVDDANLRLALSLAPQGDRQLLELSGAIGDVRVQLDRSAVAEPGRSPT